MGRGLAHGIIPDGWWRMSGQSHVPRFFLSTSPEQSPTRARRLSDRPDGKLEPVKNRPRAPHIARRKNRGTICASPFATRGNDSTVARVPALAGQPITYIK